MNRFYSYFQKTALRFSVRLTMLAIACSLLNAATAQAADRSSAAARQTVIVTDFIGRKVEVPARVQRIGCLYAFAGHVVTMLGRCADIVTVANGLRRDVLLCRMCPNIRDAVGPKAQGAINIEELLNTRPDVLFISPETGRNEAELKKLEQFKIPSIVVHYKTMQEQQQAIALIGGAIGAADTAEQYNRYYRSCIERITRAAAEIPQGRHVKLYHALTEATHTDAQESLSSDWLQATGIINVSSSQAGGALDGKTRVGIEQIILWNPDVILANEPDTADAILNDRRWASVSAVKHGRVYRMPIGISRWGHPGSLETPLAVLWTAKTVYPDYFPDIDIRSETKKFYKMFFNYEVSDELLAQMLSGKGMRGAKNQEK